MGKPVQVSHAFSKNKGYVSVCFLWTRCGFYRQKNNLEALRLLPKRAIWVEGGEQRIEEWKGGFSHRDLARALLFFFQFISLLIYLLYAVQPNVKTKNFNDTFLKET